MTNDLKDNFYYDESSRSFLRWNIDIFTGKNFNIKLIAVGDSAGSLLKCRTNNYWRVQVRGKNILVHRIIYTLYHGTIDDSMVVDHIDGNGLNNNIDNLRLVQPSVNTRNATKRVDNKSGVTGVSLKKEINHQGKVVLYWLTQWQDLNGKVKSKCYSVNKYGYDEAFYMACKHRELAIRELNCQGADYSERHGK